MANFANGENLLLGAGGGYKKPVSKVIENLRLSGVTIDGIYSRIGQITTQAKDGQISLIVGDEAFLQKSGLKAMEYVKLGRGSWFW